MNRIFTHFPKACVAPKSAWRLASSKQLHHPQVSHEDQWLWPLSDNGSKFVKDHNVGTRMSLGTWTVEASKPIEQHHWDQASLHLRRMNPVMQVKIKKRDGHWWYCQDDNLDIDCEILPPGCNVVKEVVRASSTWCGMDNEVTSLNGIVVFPEAQGDPGASSPRRASHPYRYTVLMRYHHALFDGISTVSISQAFFKLLDHVFNGKSVNDSVKTGIFASHDEIKKLEKQMVASIGEDIFPEKKYRWDPVILKGFPAPGGTNPTTKFIFKTINVDDLANVKEACKREGVTFHTALMTAHQTAMIEMLQASGVQDDTFTFSVNMTTNHRRFMDKRSLPIHGLHSGLDRMYMEVDVKQKSGFWELSRKMEGMKKEHISSLAAVRQIVAQKMLAKKSLSGGDLSLPVYDYGIAAVWDINASHGDTIQVVNGVMFSFVHNSPFVSIMNYYMGKNAYMFTYNYSSSFMEEKTAAMLMDKTFDILHGKSLS